MAEHHFRLPNPLKLNDGNLSEQFRKWKRQMEVYMEASGASAKPDKARTAIILHCAGAEALEVYDQLDFGEGEDRNNPDTVLEKLRQYCNPRSNEVLMRYRFWNIVYSVPFDKFVTELRTQAEQCNFEEKEKMIRDKIVFSVPKTMKEKLLRDTDLTLKKAIDICQAYEQTTSHVQEMQHEAAGASKLNRVDKVKHEFQKNQKQKGPKKKETKGGECKFCGYQHEFDKTKCPAWGKKCSLCQGRNHFKKKCKKIHSIACEDASDSGSDEAWLNAVRSGKSRTTAQLQINGCHVRFQLDTAADVNTIQSQYVRKEQVVPTTTKLVMWNGTKMKPLGETTLRAINPKTGTEHKVKFIVVKNKFTCLLGHTTSQDLDFVKINKENFIFAVEKQSGALGTAHLTVDSSVNPKILPCRNIPLALKPKVEKALQSLIERDILKVVDEPTDWVSQMAIVEKPNGELRICIDPRPLNSALKREHYKLQTFDDVLPNLNNAKIFSKLDLKEAFWHIELDEESSYLTTMITPFGRVRWTRLPFGLNVSSEIFQKHLSIALQGLDGIINVTDDILVVGRGATKEEALVDHDVNYRKLKDRCKEKGIKLNQEKAKERYDEVSFMGHTVSERGIEPDKRKIEAILKMPTPTDVHQVRRFCGMVQYLSRFMDKLSDMMKPLRELTKKDHEFKWTSQCENAFQQVKRAITETPVLKYYTPDKTLEIQVDSSKDGLGAVLMQDGQPIEFASRTLTESEKKWAQIEKEMLAIVYGLERFDQYTFGRQVSVTTDHKPLEVIIKKPLSETPRRLQRLLMKANRYDFTLNWARGTSLVIADTLSRAYINSIEEKAKDKVYEAKCYLPDPMIQKLREETEKDDTLQSLKHLICTGWPRKKNLTVDVTPYYDLRETLSIQDGLITKGERVVIPKSMRKEMKERLHAAHMAADSMLRRARKTIFWPGMTAEIKQIANSCTACQESKPRNQKETLKQHNKGAIPWEKAATDIFHIKGRDYLVLVDYLSNFIEVDYLPTVTSKTIINKLKSHFARYGVPKILISDCGAQYTSAEFQQFAEKWGFTHETSAPGHHQANGKAESAVKIIKNMMKRCLDQSEDQYEALLELRNTPRQEGQSPAEMVFKHEPRTLLPKVNKNQSPTTRLKDRNHKIKNCFDKKAKDLKPLQKGQPIYYQNPDKSGWHPGRIQNKINERKYAVEGETGGQYTRNRVHLRQKSTPFQQRDADIEDDPPEKTSTPTQQTTTGTREEAAATKEERSTFPAESSHQSSPEAVAPNTTRVDTFHPYITRSGRTSRPNPKYN